MQRLINKSIKSTITDLPKVDMNLVNSINKKHKFKIKQVRDDLIYIDSGWLDEYYLIVEPRTKYNKKYIALYHKNNKLKTSEFHPQGRFYDYTYTFGHIASHNKKPLRGNKLDEMFKKII